MATEWKSQQGDGKYSLQFETDSKEKYKLVEKAAQMAVDGKIPCKCSECKHLKIINKEPVYAECEKQKLTFLLWQADTREHSCSYGERKCSDDL